MSKLEYGKQDISPELRKAFVHLERLAIGKTLPEIFSEYIEWSAKERTNSHLENLPISKLNGTPIKSFDPIFRVIQAEIRNRVGELEKKSLLNVPEINLNYSHSVDAMKRPQITCSRDAYLLLLHNWSDKIEFVEEFNLLLMDNSGGVLGIYNVSKGGLHDTMVDPILVFAAALKSKAPKLFWPTTTHLANLPQVRPI